MSKKAPDRMCAVNEIPKADESGFSRYFASAMSGTPAHEKQVGHLTGAIVSGEYQVDPFAVSDSILQHAMEFGRSSYAGLTI